MRIGAFQRKAADALGCLLGTDIKEARKLLSFQFQDLQVGAALIAPAEQLPRTLLSRRERNGGA